MPSPEAENVPVKALMLTWWVTTTSTPGPFQAISRARAAAVCAGLADASPKNELNAGSSCTVWPGKASCAACALYLASPAAAYVTGEVIGVNGGIVTSQVTMPRTSL